MFRRWRQQKHGFDLRRMSLRDLVVAYASHPAIHLYLALALLSLFVAWQAAETLWRVLLLTVPLTILAYPLTWYALHRFVLHSRLLYRWRLTASLWKRIHFDHHQDPHRMDVLFGSPLNTVPTILVLLIPLGWFSGGGLAGAAAAVGAGLLITCVYEFCHCIQHLNFVPRGRLAQRMKAVHLAHHFQDEHGNYGITSFVVDRLFGTYYGTVARRRSPNVFNLGYDEAEAMRFPWVAELSGGLPQNRPPLRRRDAT